jgi:hypothetical protein
MATITLGHKTYPHRDESKAKRCTEPQVAYIKLLAEELVDPYGAVTDEQLQVVEALLYDEASDIIDGLKETVKLVRTIKADAERQKYTRLPLDVGSKTLVDGVVVQATWSHSDYGVSRMITIVSQDKYRVTMFTTAEWATATNIGDIISVAGTVKNHREYREAWSTTLSRPSLKSITHPSEEETA